MGNAFARSQRSGAGLDHDHSTPPVGRSTLTQRHAVQLSEDDRKAQHAAMDAAWAAGPVQRKEKDKPTEAHGEDDRFGEAAKAAIPGRIIKTDVVGGKTRLTIGLGSEQGVKDAMEGYIKN